MVGIALELADLPGLLVHVSEQPAAGLAVEAGGGHQVEAPFHLARPGGGIELHPVIPLLYRGK
jgi:hypothetical protein